MTQQSKPENHWLFKAAFGLLAISYLISLEVAPYPLHFIHKALPILMLLGIAVFHRGHVSYWLPIALIFSACGDILLALPIANSFVLGLGSFLLAQCSYAMLLTKWRSWDKKQAWMLALLVLFLLGMAALVIPNSGDMMVAIIPYMAVIGWMAYSAILATDTDKTIVLGAVFFVVSDSVIALNKFVVDVPFEGPIIMSTYYAAQYLLVTGIIKRSSHD